MNLDLNVTNFVQTLTSLEVPAKKRFSEAQKFARTKAAETFGRPLVTERLVTIPLDEVEGQKRTFIATKVKSLKGEVYETHVRSEKIFN